MPKKLTHLLYNGINGIRINILEHGNFSTLMAAFRMIKLRSALTLTQVSHMEQYKATHPSVLIIPSSLINIFIPLRLSEYV